MKTALLFPGQGAQVVGMGKDVAEAFPAAARLFQKANDIVDYDLARICFEGPAEQLDSTAFSQPAIFVVSAAILEVLNTKLAGPATKPEVSAGLSLGEYTALYAASCISFKEALMLVQRRGKAMQAAADASDGTMVSILGLDEDKVGRLCDEAAQGELLVPANFNCPGQIVISGTRAACRRAEKLAEKYGALKAVRLRVAGAFHTGMMAPAAAVLAEAIRECTISEPAKMKTIANINARYYIDSRDIADGLVKQLVQPILWQKCMEKLLADGFEQFFEIGPGRVLTGLMKKISRKASVVNISNFQAINSLQ